MSPEPVIEFIPCQSMYKVTLKDEGIEMSTHVSLEDEISTEVEYLRRRIADEIRESFLRNRDDI